MLPPYRGLSGIGLSVPWMIQGLLSGAGLSGLGLMWPRLIEPRLNESRLINPRLSGLG